jgi:hypothetical protein
MASPQWQGLGAAGLMTFLGLVDLAMPHPDTFMDPGYSSWAIATAMILCFIILNTLTLLRIVSDGPYFGRSVLVLVSLMTFGYLLSWGLSGRHIDESGTFRWLWFVISFAWLVFFVIVRSVKRIVGIALREDERLRGGE